jgi:hypothetical protein
MYGYFAKRLPYVYLSGILGVRCTGSNNLLNSGYFSHIDNSIHKYIFTDITVSVSTSSVCITFLPNIFQRIVSIPQEGSSNLGFRGSTKNKDLNVDNNLSNVVGANL